MAYSAGSEQTVSPGAVWSLPALLAHIVCAGYILRISAVNNCCTSLRNGIDLKKIQIYGMVNNSPDQNAVWT